MHKGLVVAAGFMVGAAALAPDAQAERAIAPQRVVRTHDFWRDIAMPHAEQIAQITMRVDQALQQFDYGYGAAMDLVGENHARTLRGAYLPSCASRAGSRPTASRC